MGGPAEHSTSPYALTAPESPAQTARPDFARAGR